MHSVIFLSNCYGEDRSAALIATELKKMKPDIRIIGAPLISKGEEYEKRNIPLLIKGKVPPSGGFPTRSISGFIKDMITSSYIPIKYCMILKKNREKVDCIVAVGDIFLLILAYLGFHKRIIFLAPAKSNYQNPHYKVETWLMRKLCIKVFTHDEYTAENLRKEKVNAEFVGNPMVDELTTNSQFSKSFRAIPNSQFSIGLLPGSREEGYNNFLKILTVIEQLNKKHITLNFSTPKKPLCGVVSRVRDSYPAFVLRGNLQFITALPSTLNFQKLIVLCNKKGWVQSSKNSIKKNSTENFLYYNAFVDIVKNSDIIIGLAGTANEQAAALGKPIVAFKRDRSSNNRC